MPVGGNMDKMDGKRTETVAEQKVFWGSFWGGYESAKL